MKPPKMRLYSRAELLELLEKDVSNISDEKHKQVEQQQHLDARSSEPNEQVDPPVDLQDYAAVCSEAHNENRSADVPTTSAGSRKPPGSDSTAVSAFSYVASEPRRELQWCPAALAATREGCRSAMERYFPQLVICCWMPFNVDWTEKARSSCCACCRCMHRESSPSAGLRQSHHSHCQVHEYILIGHAEGGLVGRPFETWGMRCSEAGLLPLGVDYEVPQAVSRALQLSAPCVSSDEESNDHDFDKEPLKSPTIEKQAGRKRRRGSAEDHRGTNGRQWQSANNFHSIPPDVPAAGEVDDHTTLGNDVESTDSVASTQHELDGEFGGVGMRQQLLPLRDRPYYREGFTRLPPLPKDAEAAMSEETTESGVLLRELQQALPLSRFDSPHSLRANLCGTEEASTLSMPFLPRFLYQKLQNMHVRLPC
ncbi:LOW QUALITY PROTEIN: uncharacterized protein EMH_0062340 [Eimeria mitis]|uniref:Uncharacterized protein n=1 Tax=Eimeria mitis TaxID=44415 RepID=U6K3L9_9EIME|nr:LOW QUALITY PROTEIN: uncharacterized protein EMH_0062340 [Eimeria mitis]CDJ30912.1 hypothetical protein, conserved [Eimeria mitis]